MLPELDPLQLPLPLWSQSLTLPRQHGHPNNAPRWQPAKALPIHETTRRATLFHLRDRTKKDAVTHLTSSTSSLTPFHGAQMLFLTSKTVRAECSKALVPYKLARVHSYKTRLSLLKIERIPKALAVEAELVRRRRYGGSDFAFTEAREAKSQMDYQVDCFFHNTATAISDTLDFAYLLRLC